MKYQPLTALVHSFLIFLCPVTLLGQDVPAPWIPFTATALEKSTPNTSYWNQRSVLLEFTGLYARDSHGNFYSRMHLAIARADLPVFGPRDIVSLYDRANGVSYTIDPAKKTVRESKPHPADRHIDPLTRGQFEDIHRRDKFLGMKVISGLDCVGFEFSRSQRDDETLISAKRVVEAWYAPSLNFALIETIIYSHSHEIFEMTLRDIVSGVEPDPGLFRLPPGLKKVK